MKVIFLTGSHPRHAYVARALKETGVLAGLVIEERSVHVPQPPVNISSDLKQLFRLHFEKRAFSEDHFFGKAELPGDVKVLKVSREELNGEKVIEFIKNIEPDLILSYGVHMLSNEVINASEGEAWNIHGGLSPWYKGCITHFWPSYFLEPQMTGMTVHDLTQNLDGGNVVQQNSAKLVKGDGIHDLACRAVTGIASELPDLLRVLEEKKELEKHKHKTTGKIWVAKDWRPEHLKPIYQLYNDRIVDLVLKGQISGREPELYRQF